LICTIVVKVNGNVLYYPERKEGLCVTRAYQRDQPKVTEEFL